MTAPSAERGRGAKRGSSAGGAPPAAAGGRLSTLFGRWSRAAASVVGHPGAFLAAFAFVLSWAVAGPVFGFSEAWQLVINTSTTILTFLMIFLLQNSQNRDTEAVQLKLDELIRSIEGARNSMVGVEQLDGDERARLQESFGALAENARRVEGSGGEPVDPPRSPPGPR